MVTPMAIRSSTAKHKWVIRKWRDGQWYVWMPFDSLPVRFFPSWGQALTFYQVRSAGPTLADWARLHRMGRM